MSWGGLWPKAEDQPKVETPGQGGEPAGPKFKHQCLSLEDRVEEAYVYIASDPITGLVLARLKVRAKLQQ